MSKEQAFVISDPHGCYGQLISLLTNWEPETQELVVLGDLVDRGTDSADVLRLCYALMTQGHIVLRGNHDQMLFDYLTAPETELWDIYCTWYYQGGRATAQSILELEYPPDSLDYLVLRGELLNKAYVLDTLALLEHYHVWGDVLFVHAGISPVYQEDWQNAPKSDMLWTRDCYKYPNKTGKVIVSGHTPTQMIHGSNDIWVNEEENVIMIDGACAYGGQLNGVVLDKKGKVLQTYMVPNKAH